MVLEYSGVCGVQLTRHVSHNGLLTYLQWARLQEVRILAKL